MNLKSKPKRIIIIYEKQGTKTVLTGYSINGIKGAPDKPAPPEVMAYFKKTLLRQRKKELKDFIAMAEKNKIHKTTSAK